MVRIKNGRFGSNPLRVQRGVKSKYNNRKTEVLGIIFDSKREADRYLELYLAQKAGAITDLQLQVPFELIPKQTDETGKVVERAVLYKADFTYRNSDGMFVVEDAKGERTREYILKRKLMMWVYGIRVKEV